MTNYFEENPNYRATAIPSKGKCPTCGRIPSRWDWCKMHYRWECEKHQVDTHGIIIGDLNATTTRVTSAGFEPS